MNLAIASLQSAFGIAEIAAIRASNRVDASQKSIAIAQTMIEMGQSIAKTMASMKYIFLLLILCSCKSKNTTIKSTEFAVRGADFEIIEIDGCEYLTYCFGCRRGVFTHKGNCKNPVHVCK